MVTLNQYMRTDGAPEVLVDTSLEGRFENIGFFHSQSIVDRFWTSGSYRLT